MPTLVQLFEGWRFRLGHEQQGGNESNNVPCGIPSECTLGFESTRQTWERDRDDKVAL